MTLDELLVHVTDNDRICPQPQIWNALYRTLPNTRQVGARWVPPLPLILGAWSFSSDDDKARRFREHLEHANAHGALPTIVEFLTRLQEDDWHHRGR